MRSYKQLVVVGAALALTTGIIAAADQVPAAGGDIEITPIIHNSVQIEYAGMVIQVDPWSMGGLSHYKPADLILISDDPDHHLDPGAIQKLKPRNLRSCGRPTALLDSLTRTCHSRVTTCLRQTAIFMESPLRAAGDYGGRASSVESQQPAGSSLRPWA